MSLRVALYTRVSTEDQAREGYSLATQREYLENCAKQHDWVVVYDSSGNIYVDDGYSAGSTNRPALQRLMRDAKAGRFDCVLFYKLDRFSRNQRDLLNLIEDLESWQVAFKSATEPFDTTTSSGKLMLQQLGSFAEFERARIAERVRPGMERSVKEGKWHGARYAPYGYRYNKGKALLELNPKEVRIVKLIYSMYLAGQSTGRIAAYMFQKGYCTPSGGRFHTQFVGRILKNEIYIGRIVWNKKRYDKRQRTPHGYKYVKNPESSHISAEGKHKAIIPIEDFKKVQERLRANRKGVVHRASSKEYPLSDVRLR